MTRNVLLSARLYARKTLFGLSALAFACSHGTTRSGQDSAAEGGERGQVGGSQGRGGAGGAGGSNARGGTLGTENGGAGGSTRSGDAGSTSVLRADEVCRAYIQASCDRRRDCFGQEVAKACETFLDRCPDYFFGPRSARTVEDVEACIPKIKQQTCTDVAMGGYVDCFVPGLGASGDPCTSSSDCASGNCKVNYPGCGTCSAPAGIGKPCDPNTRCVSGATCHRMNRICVPAPLKVTYAAAGEHCDFGAAEPIGCMGDLACLATDRDSYAGTCTSLPKQGERCMENVVAVFATGSVCAPGFECGIDRSDGLRTARCGNPAPCGKTVCDANSYCYETPSVFNVCQPYALPGGACNDDNYGERLCTDGAVCVPRSDAGGQGTCVTVVEVGLDEACGATASCKRPHYCQNGRCTSFDSASCFR